MARRERLILISLLFGIALLTVWDIAGDYAEGAAIWHLLTEGVIAALAGGGAIRLLGGLFRMQRELEAEQRMTAELSLEAQKWRQISRSYMDGLSAEIERQLEQWGLTAAEKDVAFLLLKGLSDKEIADLRNTSARTVRTQTGLIYAKSGVPGRSAFLAFFLEDLIPPGR
jgi:DNA-binding CsgD family transcriptional regulator